MTNYKITQKLQTLNNVLVANYGEGAIVQRKQILKVIEKHKDCYPAITYITNNPGYRKGWNQFLVTAKVFPMHKVETKPLIPKMSRQAVEFLDTLSEVLSFKNMMIPPNGLNHHNSV